ncbi:MAG: hypothetical protein AAF602_19220 [Myxococcota bacterium]
MRSRLLLVALISCSELGSAVVDGEPTETEASPPVCEPDALSDAYERYVEPFVSGAVASSCSQCHMTGIDISLYAQDTPCDTFACMVEYGVVTPDDPESSPLLAQIRMGDPRSSVFDVQQEASAMLEWIRWNARCHESLCGTIDGACATGTGATSTGRTPLGDCSEDDVLAAFWDAVIVDRGRCFVCHSDSGQQLGTFGPCETTDDCEFQQICFEGTCYAPGPLLAPHFFEGVGAALSWDDPDDRQLGLNTLYNVAATGLFDRDDPLSSSMLVKPLLQDFQPLAIYGDGIALEDIPAGSGLGVEHGGTSKFNFGCHGGDCITEGVVDCRTDVRCSDVPCPDGRRCQDGFCRVAGSVCDETYVRYAAFAEYFATCTP